MQFSANLSMLFTEYPFFERFEEAAACGFSAVEFWFPFKYGGKDLLPIIQSSGVQVVLFNLDPGNIQQGEWGTLGIPGRKDHFKWAFEKAVDLALLLNCRRLNALAGVRPTFVNSECFFDQIRENLNWAAGQLSDGMQLVLETLNPFDNPGYILTRPEQTLELVREINNPAIAMLLDIYHTSRVGVDIVNLIYDASQWIKHIQIADSPERHQPGTGTIPFKQVFDAIQKIGYEGYIGLEYKPLGSTRETLDWRQAWTV
jgi:hydroxypyruvate isomerase